MQLDKSWHLIHLRPKGAVSIALKYIIPLILGLLVLMFYFIFFGPSPLINLLNNSFNVSFQNI